MVLELTTDLFKFRTAWRYEGATAAHIRESIKNNNDDDVSLNTSLVVGADILIQELLAIEPNQEPEILQYNFTTNSTNATFIPNATDILQRSLPPTDAPSTAAAEEQLGERRRMEEDLRPIEIYLVVPIDYRSEMQDYDVSTWVAEAFNSPEEREEYLARLKSTGDDNFAHLTSVEILDVDGSQPVEETDQPTGSPTNSPTEQPDDNTGLVGVYIGSVFGGVAAVGLVFLGILLQSRKQARREMKKGKKLAQPSSSTESNPKVQTEIVVDRQQDDISTLGDPVFGGHTGAAGGMAFQEQLQRDERTASVADADYDYSRQMYPNNNNNSTNRERLFSADSQPITLARNTSSQSDYSTKLGGGPMGASVFSDDGSFEQQFQNQGADGSGRGDEYFEQFVVDVPEGKLGMVRLLTFPKFGMTRMNLLLTFSLIPLLLTRSLTHRMVEFQWYTP